MTKYNQGNLFSDNKNYIILSATIDEAICKAMFGKNINFIDCGRVKPKGKILLYPKYTCSRSCLADDKRQDDIYEYIDTNTDIAYPTISFKSYETALKEKGFNVVNHYGSTVGLNNLSGEKINIIGVPHLSHHIYSLYAKIIFNKDCSNDSMALRTTKRHGFEFKFFTYNDESMQKLQFYLIESEYLQAIGRSRVNREKNAEVHIFSNLPVPFCEVVNNNQDKLPLDITIQQIA